MQNSQPNNGADRLDKARAIMEEHADDLDILIWARLNGESTDLPPLTRDEEPADIFVDIVCRRIEPELTRSIRNSSAFALTEHISAGGPEVTALGHLLYLCGRIEATGAIESIRSLLQSGPLLCAEVSPGETLRLRALRAYVGLLAADFRRMSPKYPEVRYHKDILVLDELLALPDCAIVAAIGIAGLQSESRAEVLERFPVESSARRMVESGIRVAGFARENPVSSEPASSVRQH